LDSVNDKAPATEPRGGWKAEIDKEGQVVLPAQFRQLYGLKPGAKIHLEEAMIGLRMRQPVTHLAKVYIEPTNCCDLECRTCIQNTWDEALGFEREISLLGLWLHRRTSNLSLGAFLAGK